MTRRLLFVHAHPDDESSKGAATAARYVDEDVRVVLVTCTGGEAGEILNPASEVVDDMPTTRRLELEAACEIIGFADRYDLGFTDSGYHEDFSGIPEGAFARQPVDEPATGLAAIIRKEQPHVVVTYPEDGGYPHPDHVMCYEVTMRALALADGGIGAEQSADPEGESGDGTASVDATGSADESGAADVDVAGESWRVPKVYACHAFPPDRVLALHEALLERTGESPFEGWMERHAEREAKDQTRGPWPCDARIWVADWFERRDAALHRHTTQVDPDGMWFSCPRDLEREVFPWECFTLLRSDVTRPDDEDDLFAGI